MMVTEYEYRCVHSPTCDAGADTHGLECERVNDEARTDFYFALAAEAYAVKVDKLVQDVLDQS